MLSRRVLDWNRVQEVVGSNPTALISFPKK
jgi:hypothetical protein